MTQGNGKNQGAGGVRVPIRSPEFDARVIVLRNTGMTYGEIADALGCSSGTVSLVLTECGMTLRRGEMPPRIDDAGRAEVIRMWTKSTENQHDIAIALGISQSTVCKTIHEAGLRRFRKNASDLQKWERIGETAPGPASKPKGGPLPGWERHALELKSRGFRPSQIAAVTKAPYRDVEAVCRA